MWFLSRFVSMFYHSKMKMGIVVYLKKWKFQWLGQLKMGRENRIFMSESRYKFREARKMRKGS